jgi:hypothetical protein
MALWQPLHRVLANLREGRPAEAVRTDEPVRASDAFRQRMQATAATDTFVECLLPALPPRLRPVLQAAIRVHDGRAVTTLAGVIDRVVQYRDNLLRVQDRACLPFTPAQQAELDGLSELLQQLPALAEPGAVDATPTASR